MPNFSMYSRLTGMALGVRRTSGSAGTSPLAATAASGAVQQWTGLHYHDRWRCLNCFCNCSHGLDGRCNIPWWTPNLIDAIDRPLLIIGQSMKRATNLSPHLLSKQALIQTCCEAQRTFPPASVQLHRSSFLLIQPS